MFPLPLLAHLALLVVYVPAVSAALSINEPPERSFPIASAPGSRPAYSRVSVNHDSTHAANLDDPGAFTVLSPDKSIGVTRDLPSTYSFAQSEAGDDSIEPSNLFAYIDADETPKDLHATVEGIAKAKHSHNLAASRNPHDKRIGWRPGGSDSKPSFKHCSGERRDIIKWAAEDAQVALDRAIAVSERIVEEGPSADRGYYRTWFGTYSEARAHTVWSKLRRIKPNLSFLGFTYDCKCNEALPSDIVDGTRKIKICRPFWDLPQDDQSAQLVRMATRGMQGMRGIDLWAVGIDAARRLALENPSFAVKNLDNYVAFIWKKPDPLDLPPPYGPPPAHDRPPPPYSEWREVL